MKENVKPTPETIARTVILVLALLNQAFALVGMPLIGIEDALIYELASLVTTIAAAVWAWWKNNSLTKEAIEADEYMASLKSAKHAK